MYTSLELRNTLANDLEGALTKHSESETTGRDCQGCIMEEQHSNE